MTDKLTFTGIPKEELAERYRKIRAIFELGEALGCPNLLRDAIEGDQYADARYPWVLGVYYGQAKVNDMRCDLYLTVDENLFDAGGQLSFRAFPDLDYNYDHDPCLVKYFILRVNPEGEVTSIEESDVQ